jgi:transposase-like protein
VAGTVFHDSHLSLRKWFAATYIMTESKKGVSALQLQRMLGLGSYRTAWHMCHRIRSAMEDAHPEKLTGIVEADETLIGGKERFKHMERRRPNAWGPLLDKKATILGAISRDGKVRLRVAPNNRKEHVRAFLADVVADDAEAIYTDTLGSYHGVGDADTVHASVNHQEKEWVRGQVHTNTLEGVWSLFDRAIIGSYHQLSKKHLAAYVKEFEWRFNNRDNHNLFRDTLTRLVNGDVLTYRGLIAS